MLSKMVSRYEVTRVSIQQTQRTIEQNADDYRSFHDRYTSLKEEMEQPDLSDPSGPSGPGSSGHLDRYLTVVARVLADKGLKETLTDVNRSKGPAVAATATPGKRPSKERRPVGRDYDKENSTGGVNANILSPRAPGLGDYEYPSTANTPAAANITDSSGFALRSPYRGHQVVQHKLSMDEISGSLGTTQPRTPAAAAEEENTTTKKKTSYLHSELLQNAAAESSHLASNRKGHFLQLSLQDQEEEGEGGSGSGGPALPQWALSHPVVYSGQAVHSLLEGECQAGLPSTSLEIHSEYSSLEPELQELMLLDDLLYVFLGSKGKLIHPRYRKESNQIDFTIDGSLDYSLRVLAEKFLPICVSLQVLQVFIETRFEYSHGLVNQALAAVVKEVVWEWRLLVSQMESMLQDGKLSLHSMWYYCQPSVGMLKTLSTVLSKVINGNLRGSEVLNAIHDRMQNNKGDQRKYGILESLMKAASKPYLGMLKAWLEEGKVDDPYNEFLVIVVSSLTLSESLSSFNTYWQQCYRLREGAHVPFFLQGLEDKILRTGKYVALGQLLKKERDPSSSCGLATSTHLVVDNNENNHHLSVGKIPTPNIILSHFSRASKLLLSEVDLDLLNAVLKKLKRKYLFSCGGGDQDVMEGVEDDLKVKSSPPFFSLIVTTELIGKYEMIFEQISELKERERGLVEEWKGFRRGGFEPSLVSCLEVHKSLHEITDRMTTIFQVIDSSYTKMEENILKAGYIEQVVKCHEDFLDGVISIL
jgi:hypothetical protein